MVISRVMSFLKESPPWLWVVLSFTVFAVHVGVTMVNIYLQRGNGLSAVLTFLTVVTVAGIVHFFVFRSLRGQGASARVIPSVFGILSGLAWLGQLVWMSIPGVFCAVMLVLASNSAHAEGDPEDPVGA